MKLSQEAGISIWEKKKSRDKVSTLMFGTKRSNRKKKTRKEKSKRGFYVKEKNFKQRWIITLMARKVDQEVDLGYLVSHLVLMLDRMDNKRQRCFKCRILLKQ